MKRKLVALVAALTMAISNVPALAATSDAIYVSESGSDNAAGTSASPVKTIAKAIELAGTKKAAGDDVTVIIKDGTYRFDSTVNITSALSGTKEKSTVIKAEDGAEVVFKASKELDVSRAEAVTDQAVLSRLYDDVRDKVVVIDLAAQGLAKGDILDPSAINGNYALFGWEESWAENNAVYLNGAEQQLSRWPNNREYAVWSNGSGATFAYSDAAPSRWASAKDFWINSFAEFDYISSRMAVKSVDTAKKQITVIDNPVASFKSEKSRRWAAYNLLEEIDIPGEYYIDRENMKLYMYAPENFASSTLEIDVLGAAMLNITEADNITFQGIDFAQTRSNAVFMKNVDNVDFIDCSFENIGVNGILCRGSVTAQTGKSHWEVQQLDGSYNVDIKGCDFFNIGMGAIDITGGNVDTLTKSNNVIENCIINKTAQKSSNWEAISIRGCGITVKNNNISNTPMQVIHPWGSLHTIEYNEIYDALHENDDCGMIYWGGNSVLRGTEVNYNYIHDAQAQYDLVDENKHSAIYWDELQSGMSAQKNIFANIDGTSLFLNGAGATTHKYNTTVNSNSVLNLQNHAQRLLPTVSMADGYTDISVAKNELANKDLYYSTFEGLKELLEDGKNPLYYNKITNNFSYGTPAGTIESSYKSYSTVENNQNVSSGDYFVNPAAQDYRIKAAAKASVNDYASLLNEENFDIESIGIQRSYALNSETAGFDLVSPANGKLMDYTDGKIMLKWNQAPGANSYKVTVAKDKAFEAVVFTKETKATSQEVTGLEDTETYYWKVEAKNISRELGATWTNNGGAYKFSYAKMTEFVAPAKPENLMSAPNTGNVFGNANAPTITKNYNNTSNWNNTYNAFEGYFVETTANTVANAAYYAKLAGVVTTGGAGGLAGKTLTPGKNYVLSFLARNAGNTDSVNLNFGLGNVDTWADCVYSKEKGEAGYDVSDKEEWTKVAGTITAPSANPYLSIGFPEGTPAGTKVEFNLCYKPEDAIYFAEEVLYDFKLESDKASANAGDTITLNAALLNQIGTAIAGDKELTWYAMDSEKKNIVNSITITPSADTKSATASVALDVKSGTYAIVAYSEADKFAKSIMIEVAGANDKYADYVPGTKPANMMTAPNAGDVFGNVNVMDGSITKSYNSNSNWNNTYNAYEGYFIEATKNTVANAAYYSKLAGVVTTNNAGGLVGKTLTPGKNYVVSFLARNAGNTDSFNINFGLGNVNTWADCVYSNENGEAGFTVADKSGWTKVAGTITAPSAVPYLSIGFPEGTPAGTKAEINLCYKPADTIYFAEEAAYDIDAKRTSGDAVVASGSQFTAEAKLLNQVGTAYAGEQTFTWYALNQGRSAEIADITITPSADTKTATVRVGSGVESGKYVIVAVSNEYEMAKGFEFSVESTTEIFKDHIPGSKPANMMQNPTGGEVFGNANSATVEKKFSASDWNSDYGTYNGYQITALSETANTGSYANVSGITITNTAGGLSGDSLVAGKAYVVSFLARNNGTTDSFKVNMGLTNADGSWAPTYTLEKGEAGYTVSDKENWTKIAGTFVAPGKTPFLSIGFMNGQAKGSGMEFNLAYVPEEAIYFAEEVAYDIEVTSDKAEANILDTINLEANVFNQVGTKGSLDQSFNWYVLSADRAAVAEGFTVTASGNTAQVVAGANIATGDYTVVAVSKEYGFVKGVKVSVNGVNDIYKDTAPVAKPANMMQNPTGGEVFGNANSATVEKKFSLSDWNSDYNTYNGYQIAALSETANTGSYANVSGITITNTAGGLMGDSLVAEKGYVVSFLARNNGTTDSFKVNMGLTNADGNWAPTYTLEKGEAGYTVSDKENWTKIAGTFVAPCATPFLSIGFMNGEAVGTSMEFNLAYKPDDAIYFAEEVAYDIELTGKDAVTCGENAEFEAKVINQIGTAGSLSQDIDWYVVNELRTSEADGLAITAGEAGKAILSVDNNADAGTYYVIARSEKYNITKSFEVSVGEREALFVDTIPGAKPANMMQNPTAGDVFGNKNSDTTDKMFSSSDWNTEYNTYNGYQIKAIKETFNTGSYSNVSGITTTNTVGGLMGDILEKGKAYVVSFLARNNGTTDSFKINMGLTNADGNWAPTYTLEKGEEGYTVSDKKNWTKIAGTFVAPGRTPFLSIGFMNGQPAGSGMEFNLAYVPEEAIYFAEEVAYDIEVTTEKPVVSLGSTAEFEAKALNQIGTKGNLSQSFTWYVVNADRTEMADGFTLTKSGNKVTVSADNTVKAGIYTIVAVSDDYSLVKGIEFVVTEPEYQVKDVILTVENGVATAKVTTDVENAKVFLAVYNGTRLVGADMGVAGEELTLSAVGAGSVVKVFAWNMQKLIPLTVNPNQSMSLTVQ